MSRTDLNAIPRIIEACEGPSHIPTGDSCDRAVVARDTINHLMGATRTDQYVSRLGSDLVVPPLVLARMLRAAGGEHVELGRLIFLGNAPLKQQADDIAEAARKLMDLCRAGSTLRGQVEASLEADKERRHQVAVIKDELLGGNIDAALDQLSGLLASWGG